MTMPSAMAVAVWKAVKKPAITCQGGLGLGLEGRLQVRDRVRVRVRVRVLV